MEVHYEGSTAWVAAECTEAEQADPSALKELCKLAVTDYVQSGKEKLEGKEAKIVHRIVQERTLESRQLENIIGTILTTQARLLSAIRIMLLHSVQ